MPIAVRCAEPADLPSLLELYRHLSPEDPLLGIEAAQPAWSALLASSSTTVFVADLEGALVSSCVLAVIPNLTRNARPFAVIENVVTHLAHRRQGFGTLVLRTALEAGWSAGCYKIMLATGSQQASTLRFYEAVGMTKGGKTFFQARRD
jgi:GNAT superfamily N-acetyltransferase